MSVLTVRNLDPQVKTQLRVRAAQQGIAMEEAVRRILTKAANEPVGAVVAGNDLAVRIRARFTELGALDVLGESDGLPLAPRHALRTPPFADELSGD
jgi:antitoxin FitA